MKNRIYRNFRNALMLWIEYADSKDETLAKFVTEQYLKAKKDFDNHFKK